MNLRPLRLLAVCALVLVSGCTIDLQHNLSEQDANDIYVLLNENGISAKKQKEEGGNEPTYMITVPKQDASQAAKLMREYSLPRPASTGFADVAKSSGMIKTAVEERAIMLNAVSGEVTRALNQVDGILESHVIVQIPEKNDLSQPDKVPMPTASAFVKYRATLDGKPPIDEVLVKRFVATSVENLKPESVTVIMSQAQPPSADVNPESRLQDFMGLRITASSLAQLKLMLSVAALLILALAGFTAWTFARGGGGGSRPARPRA